MAREGAGPALAVADVNACSLGRQAAHVIEATSSSSSSNNSLQEQLGHVYVPRLHRDVQGGLVQRLQLLPTAAGGNAVQACRIRGR